MRTIISDPQKDTPTIHFSHPHPLKLINCHQQTLNLAATCAGCKLKPSGMIYSCTTCNFFLHEKCFEMPKNITHPFHKAHALVLLPEPAYPHGLFNCDGCGETGNGFSYHCQPCGIDLHILCASMPVSVTHASHVHKLDLAFENPYGNKAYCCHICKNIGLRYWLYTCSLCGFDAHFNCARGVPPPLQPQSLINFMGLQSQGQTPPQQAATYSTSAPQPQVQGIRPQFLAESPQLMQPNILLNHGLNNEAAGVPVGGQVMPPFGVNRTQNAFATLELIQQIISNNNAMSQVMLAGGAGGVGGRLGVGVGADGGLQQQLQLLSSLNIGGGGGGNVPGLNAFGGGAGGQDFLQALMNGGSGGGIGGGGLDFLQSMLGGENGLDFLGGGGLDFLGGALGGFSL